MVYYPKDISVAIKKEAYRRRYSPRTIKTYQKCIERFLRKTRKGVDKISKVDAREFLSDLSEKGVAGSTLHVYHMAIRFLFEDVLNKRIQLDLRYSRKPKKLPTVLGKSEVWKLIQSIKNGKHRLMISLMYGAGLRVSELINLKICDLVLDNGYGFVRNGKGGKDRIFVIDSLLIPVINNLIEIEELDFNGLLFISSRARKYSVRTLQVIVKRAAKQACLENWKEVHPHTLRHSFATHLIKNGYDVTNVQAMLGHKSPETSMIYVHMASPNMINVKSPLGSLKNLGESAKSEIFNQA